MRLPSCAFILLAPAFSSAQWSLNHQTPNHEIVKALSAPTDSTCWFVTNFNRLYKTSDGGTVWTVVPPGAPSFLPYGLFVVNDLVGFKCSSSDVYKTEDGGASWNSVFSGSGSLAPVVWMTNATTGVLTKNGILYKTIDGGDTWSTSGITQPPADITGSTGKGVISAHGDSLWVTQVNGGIAFSPDLGNTWTTPANNGLMFGTTPRISFANAAFGMAIMHSNPFVFLTTDGGDNWTQADNSLGANEDVLGIGSECWYIPDSFDHFYIKYSADNGATWTQQLFDQDGFEVLEGSREGHTLWAGTEIGKIYKYDNAVPLGIAARHVDQAIRAAPNPCVDRVEVTSTGPLVPARFRICSLTGAMVQQGDLINATIDTRSWPSGYYVLELLDTPGRSLGHARLMKM